MKLFILLVLEKLMKVIGINIIVWVKMIGIILVVFIFKGMYCFVLLYCLLLMIFFVYCIGIFFVFCIKRIVLVIMISRNIILNKNMIKLLVLLVIWEINFWNNDWGRWVIILIKIINEILLLIFLFVIFLLSYRINIFLVVKIMVEVIMNRV